MSKRKPKDLNLVASFRIAAAASGSPEQAAGKGPAVRRFEIVAYTGGALRLADWRLPVVVDLAGLEVGDQSRAILLAHNADVEDIVGQTDRIEIVEGQLVAMGDVLGDSARVQRMIALADKGFNWQASIGARADEVEFIKAGKTVTVNGKPFAGPVNVARRAVLGEISFVTRGADGGTAARIAANANDTKETDMDFNQWLEARGFNADDLDDKQRQALQAMYNAESAAQPDADDAATATATEDPPDAVAQLRASTAGELKRQNRITEICGTDHRDIAATAVAEGWDGTRTELEVLRASRPKSPAVGTDSDRKPDTRVLVATACMSAGMRDDRLLASFGEEAVNRADQLRGIGLQEFCALAAGQHLPRFNSDASGWLRAAFSTLSLPGILSNVANKMLLDGFGYVEDAWRQVCKIGSVRDFKEHTRYRLTGDMKYQKVGKDGELKHGEVGEETFSQKADTHGIMFSLTYPDIVNDDLGAFAEIPQMLGMGAAEAIAEAVFTLLLSNPSSFFSVAHKNYQEGTDTELSIGGLTIAEQMFLEQTKPNGRPLGIAPSVLLVPPALNVVGSQLLNATQVNETTTANKPKPATNPHAGKFAVVSSAYLSNAGFTGNSNKAWYLLADPMRLPAIEVAFLNGRQTPTVERADADFNKLGIQFRGYINFGVKEQDYRGAVKMKGEA
jgi:Mu-like prophage major head subunit gpT